MSGFLTFLKQLFAFGALFVYLATFSQNTDDSERQFENELSQIDQKIAAKQYGEASLLLEGLENDGLFPKSEDIRYKIDFRKAKLLFSDGKDSEAINLLLKNLEKLNKKGVSNSYVRYTLYLADIFKKANNYKRSRYYYHLSLKNTKENNDSIKNIDALVGLGNVFYKQKIIDSATYYFEQVIKYSPNPKTQSFIAKAYNNLGIIASDEGDFGKSEDYADKYLAIVKEHGSKIDLATAYTNMGNIYYDKKDYKKSEKLYQDAYDVVKKDATARGTEVLSGIIYNLAFVNEELKDYKKAYYYLDEATDLTDSLAEVKRAKNISELEAKYNYEKQADEEQSKTSRAQLLFYSSAFALLSFLVLGYIFYRNYRLKQQNRIEHIENETQTKIINATVDAKEKERKAIAETLHDSVSALLSSANLHLQATKAQLKEEAPQEITKAQAIVNEASVKIRDLSHELISSILLKFGLAFAIHDMCQKYSNSEITLHSDDDGIKRYDQDFEIKIHNIVEELVNNILKHSKASNATIMLAHRDNDMLSVRVSDDGVGFNPKNVRGKDGLGLSHIEARIKVMKGVFNIISSVENGTNIFISVPIKFKEKIA